jgi:hypothetical protein
MVLYEMTVAGTVLRVCKTCSLQRVFKLSMQNFTCVKGDINLLVLLLVIKYFSAFYFTVPPFVLYAKC